MYCHLPICYISGYIKTIKNQLISNQRGRAVLGAVSLVVARSGWVRIPLETQIFILNFSIPSCSEQLRGSHANEIKHDHSPVVIVVLDPRYN